MSAWESTLKDDLKIILDKLEDCGTYNELDLQIEEFRSNHNV